MVQKLLVMRKRYKGRNKKAIEKELKRQFK